MIRRPALLLLASTLVAGLTATPPAQAAERPNVVVIQTDDQSLDTMQALPRTRALIGGAGVTFADYHVSFSLCCPSRASLLTGLYAHNTGVQGNVPPRGSVLAFNPRRALPVWLKRAGYTTAHVGKYLNLYTVGIPPGWDEWFTGIDPTTYRYFGYAVNDNGLPRYFGHRERDYSTDVYTDHAVKFVRKAAGGDEPFFLALDYVAPHTEVALLPRLLPGGPPVPAPRDAGRFADEPLPRDPSFDEADVSDKPAHVRARPRLSDEKIAEMTAMHRARLESLSAVDHGVERLISALRETGQLENTYVVFLSDNGWMNGQHRYPEGKLRMYEPSTRLPLLIRGPGVARDRRTQAPAMNIDIAPTILDWTGASPDLEPDGVSLDPILSNPDLRPSRDLLHEFVASDPLVGGLLGDGDTGSNDPSFTAVRSSDGYVYAEHETGEKELYDLTSDPYQLANCADDPAFASTQARLAERLAKLRTCAGPNCR